MHEDRPPTIPTVTAACEGDQNALDRLTAESLPLVYNIVGRALDGHADVDDVVQETMLRVIEGLKGLREPASYRSWLVTIAVRQVRERWRTRQAQPLTALTAEPVEPADPKADFADLTILRLGLTEQRMETVQATRWLEPEERDVLSLWWLEACGELTRAELAAGCDLPPQHAAVRVQRVKARLTAARTVIRALAREPRCTGLQDLVRSWNGTPSPLWRNRIARHIGECPHCARQSRDLVPVDGLLAGLGLVPLPVGYLVSDALTTASVTSTAPTGRSAGKSARHAGGGTGKGLAKGIAHSTLVGKAAVAVAAVVVTGGTVALVHDLDDTRTSQGAAVRSEPATVATPPADRTDAVGADAERPDKPAGGTDRVADEPGTRAKPAASGGAPSAAEEKPSTSLSEAAGPVYGQTVDAMDTAPALLSEPLPLPRRPEPTPITVTGKYSQPFKGSLGGKYLMFWQGDHTTITGKGYFCVRYEIAWFNRAGLMQMPTWTGLKGELFHVASGGGRRLTDRHPGEPEGHTWMGNPVDGYITLPAGAQQMWQNEYFYLDGAVTLHLNETGPADYNLSVTPYTWDGITQEINATPRAGTDIVRYGMVRDTGTDAAPVPQYLTRSTPSDPMSVPRRSQVGPES